MINVKYVILDSNAVEPKYANIGDAGMDLTAISQEIEGDIVTYGTGIAMQIPEGHVGLLFPRSSIYKKNLSMANSVGVIDSGYRGEIMFKFRKNDENIYNTGERVGQIVIVELPKVNIERVEQLDRTNRGEGGFGSSGI